MVAITKASPKQQCPEKETNIKQEKLLGERRRGKYREKEDRRISEGQIKKTHQLFTTLIKH